VHVPRSKMVGQENRGWYHVMVSLDFERTAGVTQMITNRRNFNDLTLLAKETKFDGEYLTKDPVVRSKLAELAVDLDVGRTLAYRVAWMLSKNMVPNYEASMLKVFAYELSYRILRTGTQVMRHYGQLDMGSKWSPLEGRLANLYLTAPGFITAAGTHEIQRNIIAQRGLGLPR